MKSNGKIYVVMAVVIVIVAGLFLYLLNLDGKITKLEKKN
jgi:CcmD family protein